VDLNKVENDQLEIELITPKMNSDIAVYKFPAMVPGTYKIYDFGRYVPELKAFDNSGNELTVNKPNVNSWEISNASNLYKLVYKINDTFGDTLDPKIFEPAGTSIEKDTVFVVNNHGFFGYFDGYLSNDYTVTFKKPAGFFGSTSLIPDSRTETEETFSAPDYNFLVDNPIMFCIPDTTSVNFEECKVLISVFSPGKGITSAAVTEKIKDVLVAIRKFLGGKLSADRYTFLYYFSDNEGGSGGFGALEHNYSSFYFMPDVPKESSSFMINQLMSTSAHEFYHTVTPLNLHSEEIGNFDFNDPKMSEHLWLYEGVTEYNADYIQLREGLINLKDYAAIIKSKLNGSSRYNDTLPFTEMSKGALDKYESQYINVYEKGALIGLSLDILIRQESNGSQGLQDVINELVLRYGKEKSFKDEELFGEIVTLTSPKIGEFFNRYVAGPEKIPYSEILEKAGFNLIKNPYNVIDMKGSLDIGFNQNTFRLKINKLNFTESTFINELRIKAGDELISFNGNQISFQNARNIFGSAKNNVKAGDKFELVVARTDANGKENQVTLKAIVKDVKTAYDFDVKINDKPDAQQMMLKNAWLGK